MKKKTIGIILILTAISLIGLISTQLFWIQNAISLSGDQFDHRVTVALKEVLEGLQSSTPDPDEPIKGGCNVSCSSRDGQKHPTINTAILDSLMKLHFINHQLDTVYEFAIVECGSSSPLFEKNDVISNEIQTSCHKAGLSCIWKKQCANLEVFFPDKQGFIINRMAVWLAISILFLLIVLFSFSFIVHTIFRQKKLSEIKNDFINNMTHELKTPISTISMASEVLMNSDTSISTERTKKYTRVIFEENQRLKSQVERVLETAEMEKKTYTIRKDRPVDIHQIIRDTMDNLCLEDCEKDVKLSYHLNAAKYLIPVDKLHFENVINNLVDNAYKYSGENPDIEICTENIDSGIIISVIDNGMGMTHETQKNIFNKFYRLPTGNIHNVKGFGLGLYYVKNIVELHGGSIKVKSTVKKGSRFDVFLPF